MCGHSSGCAPALLPKHSLSFCFASPQDHLTADALLRLYALLYTSKVVKASIHTIKKIISLNHLFGLRSNHTTHKLIKKRSYRQNCLISGWFGLRPFSEIIDANNEMAVAIHLSEKANISI